jgi:hypothetical protein
MKLKSLLAEALTPLDKKAVQSFFDGKPFEGKNLNSDGKTLKTVGIGSQPMYTHTPNGVKMVGKVTGGYSQSLVQYVNKVHKGDLGEARIPNNSTSARMSGVVSTSNITNLFKAVEPLIKELSDDGFDLEDIVGFIAKRIEAKFAGVYEGKTLNENINKDVKSFLDKSLRGLKAGSPPHLFAVKHTLIGALTDANFHSEAKKVPALFPKAEFEPTAYGESEGEAIHMYEYEVGPQIARIAEYDGGAIVDAIGFYVSMTIGRPVGEKIQKLVERSIREAAGIEAMGIAGFTGTRGDAVQKFIDDNNLDAKKLFAYIKGGKLKERMGFVSAIAGTPGNKIQKELISKFKLKEGIKEFKYPTNLYVGSVILGQGFTALKGIEDGKYYKVVEMDDISATLVPSDIKGNVKGTKKVRHKLSSIEGGIKTAKRGDENGIIVI